MSKKSKPYVYIPPDARVNTTVISSEPPSTKYDKRRATFDINEVKNLTKGNYGKQDI